MRSAEPRSWAAGTVLAAVCLPTLLAFNLPPSATSLNQLAAVGSWSLVLMVLSWHPSGRGRGRPIAASAAAPVSGLLIVGTAVVGSSLFGVLPLGLALASLGVLLCAALVLVLVSSVAARPFETVSIGLHAALLAAGVASVAVAVLQVFAPDAVPDTWIARSGMPGRAVGNLRQPNHLATLLLWSTVAVIPLLAWKELQRREAVRMVLVGLFALMLFGVVLSGSRTGLLGVAGLVVWGLLDRGLSRASRGLLLASPLICIAGWMLLGWLSSLLSTGAIGASTRLGESQDYSSGRWSIWRDTLTLIAQNPWFGVGFGEFNFAWTLTPFPDRNPQFFDHTHNLPLHLAVELGIPLALLVLGLLLWGLWQAFERSRRVEGEEGVARRAAFVMVLLMALHSQLEYPLWYAYFLLPTAFAWGLCLSGGSSGGSGGSTPHEMSDTPTARSPWMAIASVVLMVSAAVTVWDYRKVVAIFAPPIDSTATLAERIVEGRRSWFFAHHADYALVTTIEGANTLPGVFDRAPHFLLDTRLMMAWANGLAAQGDVERARHIAARLREFNNPNSKEYFAPCDDAAVLDKPYQCIPPARTFTWRDFK
jgi:hypothetical protein